MSGGPVVARKMESCESAALSRDLKTRQRLELVRSEKLTNMLWDHGVGVGFT